MEKVVVAGAGFAGIQAAFSLSKRGYNVQVLDRNSEHVYIPGLIDLLRDRCGKNDLTLDLETFFEDTSIDFSREEIKDIDPDSNQVEADEVYGYDYLVLALGGGPIIPEEFEDVNIPYNLEQASKLRNMEGSVAVIGSGYTGVELAFEFAEKGLDVETFDAETRPLPRFSEKISEKMLDLMRRENIKFRGGKKIESVEDGEVVYKEGSETFDHVILNIGIRKNRVITECFEDFEVNSGLNSVAHDNVFAVGDCNEVNPNTAHNAIYEGKKVAENISKKDYEDLEPVRPKEPGYLVGTGNKGLYIRDNLVFESRLFRYGKDLIKKWYFTNLKFQAWKRRNLM